MDKSVQFTPENIMSSIKEFFEEMQKNPEK